MAASFILRYRDYAAQPSKIDPANKTHIKRMVGFVDAKSVIDVIDNLDLDANPRSAKTGSVVSEIIETLETSTNLFHFKSKGVLLGCANVQELDRKRFRMTFEDPTVEGVLDGGHNLLAIALFILQHLMDEREFRRIRFWDEMKEAWRKHHKEIREAENEFEFLVPIELLVPVSDDSDDVDGFTSCLLDICAARNNNAQLVQEAKAEKLGLYDAVRATLPDALADRVEWKTNTWEDDTERKPINVRDIIAFAWLPLNVLNEHGALPLDISVLPQNIYRNRSECSLKFTRLMQNKCVSETAGAKSILTHDGVASAFEILGDLPSLYDAIFENFPKAHKSNGFKFGSKSMVKMYNPVKRKDLKDAGKDVGAYVTVQPRTPMFRNEMEYKYPDGLIAPLFYGLTGLMKVEDGRVIWAVDDPKEFLDRHIDKLAGAYKLALDLGGWDPQKISKNPASHELMVEQVRAVLASDTLRRKSAA